MKKLILFFLFALQYTYTLAQQDVIKTIAGGGREILNDVPATNSYIEPIGVVEDVLGNIYIAESYKIYKVTPAGILTHIAGTEPGYGGNLKPAVNAKFNQIQSICLEGSNLIIADAGNNVIRKIDSKGIVSTIAGTGVAGYNGDARAATGATLYNPTSVCADAAGNIYINDRYNYRVRKIDKQGKISTVAGNGNYGDYGYEGPAINTPISADRITIDKAGNLYIVGGRRLRKVAPNGITTTVAGNGANEGTYDGIPATQAYIGNYIQGLTTDAAGNIYFSDNQSHRIHKIDVATGIINTYCGSSAGYTGDLGLARNATLYGPYGIY
ncbi:MAG: hypothetical protein EOP47_21420, partial [Sphingobacteriaceae bacterium]